jgi:hypothetical protein
MVRGGCSIGFALVIIHLSPFNMNVGCPAVYQTLCPLPTSLVSAENVRLNRAAVVLGYRVFIFRQKFAYGL